MNSPLTQVLQIFNKEEVREFTDINGYEINEEIDVEDALDELFEEKFNQGVGYYYYDRTEYTSDNICSMIDYIKYHDIDDSLIFNEENIVNITIYLLVKYEWFEDFKNWVNAGLA